MVLKDQIIIGRLESLEKRLTHEEWSSEYDLRLVLEYLGIEKVTRGHDTRMEKIQGAK